MRINIIVATDSVGGIAKDGNIPWNCEGDLKTFKQRTMGHIVIVGRTTWEGMKTKLPGRKVIVLSKNQDYVPSKPVLSIAGNFDRALQVANREGEKEVFVIGGLRVYNEALEKAHTMYVTRITGNYSCDLFFLFPNNNCSSWLLQNVETSDISGCLFYTCVYTRMY